MGSPSWTDEELVSAYENSTSIAQILKYLGLTPSGGNYQQIKNRLDYLGLPFDTKKSQGWSKNLKLGPYKNVDEYLYNGSKITSHTLKNRLFDTGKKERKCESCQFSIWLNQPIPLELHHIDGVHRNNKIENLKILCPNCHALTDNYRGKNKIK